MKKHSLRLIACALAAASMLSLVACGGGNSAPAPSTTPDPAPETTAWDGKITIVQSSDIINWDPCASTDTNTKNCLKNIVLRCFETDDYFNVFPVLVDTFEQEDDLTWKFTLHEGVKFFDGTPVTTDDVIFCLTRAKENSSSGKTLLKPVTEFEKIDDLNFRIHTATPYGSLTTALSNTTATILSKDWVEKAEAGTCTWDDVMQNGACGRYKLGSRSMGDTVTLVKNEEYFNPDDAAMNSELVFRIIPEGTTRTIMVQTGEADVNVNLDTASMQEVMNDPNVEILQHESSTIYYIALNCESAAFSDKRVRQAVAYAINRADCLEVGYNGYGQVWENVWAPTVIGSSSNPSGYEYNAEKAKSLLADAGITELTVTAAVKTDAEERIAQVVKAFLQEVGINMEYSRIDNTILTEVMGAGQYDMCFDYTAFYNDPELFVGRQFQASGIGGKNYAHYDNADVNALMEEATKTLDEAARKDCYTQINQILCDDCPWIGLFNSNLYALQHAGVKGVNVNVETTYYYHTIRYE